MSLCTKFAVAPFDGKYLTSYLMAIVMFAFTSVYLRKFDLANIGQGTVYNFCNDAIL